MNFPETLERLHPRPLKFLRHRLDSLVQGRLWMKVLLGMLCGIVIGVVLGPSVGFVSLETSMAIGNWLALPGQLFLGLVQMIVIPLVFASIIRGLVASEDLEQLKKMGLRVVVFFLFTTALSIGLGIGLALLIKPGAYVDAELIKPASTSLTEYEVETKGVPSLAEVPQTIAGLLPDNPLGSMVHDEMLQVVLFSVIIGIALLSMPIQQSKPLLDLCGSVQEVCMTVVKGAMMLAPIAVFGLMAQLTSKVGLDVLLGLGVYVITVLAGLFAVLLLYLFTLLLFCKSNPLQFLKAIREVQLLAFSTSSSAAVMPLSIHTAEEKLGVRPSTAQFVIPLGATINMNGTALYQGVATIFLAQVFGVDLGTSALVLLVVTAVGASIGSPATPGVGIVILAMVLGSVGIPVSGLALILGVDRILDMARTSLNVTGDLLACVVMDSWVGGKRSAGEELQGQREREQLRAQTGDDVIVAESSDENLRDSIR